jgi:hypothetical protein
VVTAMEIQVSFLRAMLQASATMFTIRAGTITGR